MDHESPMVCLSDKNKHREKVLKLKFDFTYIPVGGGGLPPPPASFMPHGVGGEGGPPGRQVMSETNGNGDQVDATGYNLAFGGLTHRRPPSPGESMSY